MRMHRLKAAFRPALLANHFPALHGLRVFAIVSVLQFHVTSELKRVGLLQDSALARLSTTVFFGMDLFFLMSGFLIGTLILHAQANKKQNLVRFYVRRGFRTFPLYYVCLTILFLAFPTSATQRSNAIYEYVYLTNYHYPMKVDDLPVMWWGWSLAVEEHFYLAVPLVMAAMRRVTSHTARLSLFFIAWCSAFVVRFVTLKAEHGPRDMEEMFRALYIPTHTRYDILVAGIVLAYLQHHFHVPLRSLLARREYRAILGFVAFLGFFLLMQRELIDDWRMWRIVRWGTLSSITLTAALLLLLNTEGRVQRFLSSTVFLHIATVGYGIYLIHTPVCEHILLPLAGAMVAHGVSMMAVWPTTLALLLVLSALGSYVLHITVEKPFLYLRDRLTA